MSRLISRGAAAFVALVDRIRSRVMHQNHFFDTELNAA